MAPDALVHGLAVGPGLDQLHQESFGRGEGAIARQVALRCNLVDDQALQDTVCALQQFIAEQKGLG